MLEVDEFKSNSKRRSAKQKDETTRKLEKELELLRNKLEEKEKEIEQEIKLINLLNFVLDVYKILDERDINKILSKILLNFHMVYGKKIDFLIKTDKGFKSVIGRDCIQKSLSLLDIVGGNNHNEILNIRCFCKDSRCPDYGDKILIFPITSDRFVKGLMLFYLKEELPVSRKEIEILKSISKVIGFLISKIEVEEQKDKAYEQIVKNIENYAILIDHIRNPLSVILGVAETSIDDFGVKNIIIEEIKRIETVIKKLEDGWLESETIAKFLKRYI